MGNAKLKGIKLQAANGFTLIEVLIASAMLSIILGALYATFFLSQKAVAGLDESMLKLQECRAALDMLKRELDASFYKAGDKNTAFRLEDKDIYGRQTSVIVFTTFSPMRAGVSEIRYHVKSLDDKLILYKGISTPFGPRKGFQEHDIIEGVGEFIVEAMSGEKWVRTWDSVLLNKLPDEVRISLKIKIKDKDLMLFATARPMIV